MKLKKKRESLQDSDEQFLELFREYRPEDLIEIADRMKTQGIKSIELAIHWELFTNELVREERETNVQDARGTEAMNIIGTPPKPRAGATYTVIEEPMGRPSLPWRVRTPGGNLLPGYAQKHQAQQCADLLNDVTSRTTEPDPAVCTYGELEPGEWAVDDCYGPSMRIEESTPGGYMVSTDGERFGSDRHSGRRVPASVVVHEEPGTHVRLHHRGHDAFVNGGPCSIADLQHIVQQGAALLAQQDAQPEDDPLVQRLAKDPEALRRFNEAKPKAAEERCKGAEG